ncbi:CHAT domain-containing protein, partial [Leptolyngbya cf. ectocarpi LEGE 11479]
NNITAASLDDLDNQPFQGELSVLAAAFTEGAYEVEISDRTFYFGGLEFAGREVENLAQLIPDTDTRINADFNPDIVFDMNDFRVVHLATHATFNPGPPQNSFILFGDGNRATLTDIKNWNFPNVELIVLSACETALGEIASSNGEEILGFGYLMQLAGADAAVASLWAVNDSGTQILMNAFYGALQQGMTKAQALQTAQQALITGNFSPVGSRSRQSIAVTPTTDVGQPMSSRTNLAHPYYWAPFILIGNGL